MAIWQTVAQMPLAAGMQNAALCRGGLENAEIAQRGVWLKLLAGSIAKRDVWRMRLASPIAKHDVWQASSQAAF